jgi:hypothetical protein
MCYQKLHDPLYLLKLADHERMMVYAVLSCPYLPGFQGCGARAEQTIDPFVNGISRTDRGSSSRVRVF